MIARIYQYHCDYRKCVVERYRQRVKLARDDLELAKCNLNDAKRIYHESDKSSDESEDLYLDMKQKQFIWGRKLDHVAELEVDKDMAEQKYVACHW